MNYSLEDLYAQIDRAKSSELTIQQFTEGCKDIVTEQEAVELFKAAAVHDSSKINFSEFLQVLIQIRTARALDALEEAMNKLKGEGDAAKKFFQFDRDHSGTIDVIEFGNILEAAFRRMPKDELDSIFRTIVKNNKAELSEEDLRMAFKNKEESLVDNPIIGIYDILLPMYTKVIKRMRV
jgi:Ca2+-binding EF-hand superfamily protein